MRQWEWTHGRRQSNRRRFFLPDYTVGLGITPNLPPPPKKGGQRVADLLIDQLTASEESHLAPKQTLLN